MFAIQMVERAAASPAVSCRQSQGEFNQTMTARLETVDDTCPCGNGRGKNILSRAVDSKQIL